jgi:small subunit ribosomal protein S21
MTEGARAVAPRAHRVYNGVIVACTLEPASCVGGGPVTEVRIGKDETLDSALRRFKRQVKRSGILTDAKRHEHYEKPSQKRRRRAARRNKRH